MKGDTSMQPDMIVSWDNHLKHGNIWRIDVELPMQDAPDDAPNWLNVCVDVVAPTSNLAQYIVQEMYPDAMSIVTPDEPLST